QYYVDSGKYPGFLAVIARHGKLAYLASVGWMDVEHRRAMSPDAVFRIYSLTKPIASTAVMQLYERGKLRLDDPVSKYVPAFAGAKVYAGGSAAAPLLRDPERPVTIADLLTHSSGLTYGFFGNTPARYVDDCVPRHARYGGPPEDAVHLRQRWKTPGERAVDRNGVYAGRLDAQRRIRRKVRCSPAEAGCSRPSATTSGLPRCS